MKTTSFINLIPCSKPGIQLETYLLIIQVSEDLESLLLSLQLRSSLLQRVRQVAEALGDGLLLGSNLGNMVGILQGRHLALQTLHLLLLDHQDLLVHLRHEQTQDSVTLHHCYKGYDYSQRHQTLKIFNQIVNQLV